MALMVEHAQTHRMRSLTDHQRYTRRNTVLGFLALFGLSGLVALLMGSAEPNPRLFAWFFYLAGLIACLVRPRYGVYLVIGLGLVGDWIMWTEFPFIKNFSSEESWLYLHNALIISPMESYIGVALVSWFAQGMARRKLDFRGGPLLLPVMAFIACIVLMMGYGLGRGGANINVALWETRSILYIPMMVVLAANTIRTPRHVSVLLWTIAVSLWLRGVSGVVYIATVLQWNMDGLERIGNHAMSIFFDSVFVLFIGAVLYRASWTRRILLLLMLPPIAYSFLMNQRRASFIALAVALIVVAIILFVQQRRLFWRIVPAAAVLAVLYIGAFWNVESGPGFAAQALKSAVGLAEGENAQSNAYRDIENANIMYTIRTAPLGLGFGQKFYIAYALPDISFFEWWEYITHNAVLWMWMKAGPWGFMAMLTMYGMSLLVGAQRIRAMPNGILRIGALTFTLYILMHCIYTYVDMAWDAQSMMYIGTCIGVISVLNLIAQHTEQPKPPRWPWAPAPPAELDPEPVKRQRWPWSPAV